MTDLAARALAIAEVARQRQGADRERYRRENPELYKWKQEFFAYFGPGCKDTFFVDYQTGKTWGKRPLGVPVSVSLKPLKRRK